jgi:thiamine biosynthesis lipoprotein
MPDRPISRRDALRITAVAGVSAAVGTPLVLALLREAALHRVSETRTRMGTIVTLTVVHPEKETAHAMLAAAFTEMERLEGILTRHRPGSSVGILNATGRLDAAPVELQTVLEAARTVSVRTDGAFDITIAPLLALHEDSFRRRGAPPADADIERARALVDFDAVDVSDDRVALADPRMSITLDGIAKGFIVDRTMDVLMMSGAERVLVNAGGDISSHDKNRDDPWTVGIQDPDDSERYVGFVRLQGDCIATSGDYMRSFTNDRAHHHIIDPRTGRSPTESASVSVIERSAMTADAFSTALLVLGPDDGLALLERVAGPEAMFVGKNGTRVTTPRFGDQSI